MILESNKIKLVTVSIVSPSICHEVMGLDVMIFVFWMLSVKVIFFPEVMYGCESWTIKKAEHQRIDAFELHC